MSLWGSCSGQTPVSERLPDFQKSPATGGSAGAELPCQDKWPGVPIGGTPLVQQWGLCPAAAGKVPGTPTCSAERTPHRPPLAAPARTAYRPMQRIALTTASATHRWSGSSPDVWTGWAAACNPAGSSTRTLAAGAGFSSSTWAACSASSAAHARHRHTASGPRPCSLLAYRHRVGPHTAHPHLTPHTSSSNILAGM